MDVPQVADLETLRYPVGRLDRVTGPRDRRRRTGWIDGFVQAPAGFRSLVAGATEAQLDTRYRPGGWTIRQVVHHVPDSHMNAYIRMKWAMTEDVPAIKVYEEQLWAELPEAKTGRVDMSLALLEALHRRWVMFLKNLSDVEFARTFTHPEWGAVKVEEAVAMYAWHCRHHAAHIKQGLGIGD